jgi:15-cis-phytoene synthase
LIALADPERALAVDYAPLSLRSGLQALFALDERFGTIVANTTEPTIGLVRLAWWRETLERLGAAAAPAEPLLTIIAAEIIARGIPGGALADIEDGWAALLDGEPDAAAIARHGRERGGKLFRAAADLLSSANEAVVAAGTGWALSDLAHRHSDPVVKAEARRQALAALATAPRHWPKPLRPLGALGVLARRDAFHAGPRAQGSPGRVARMLAMRLTGR